MRQADRQTVLILLVLFSSLSVPDCEECGDPIPVGESWATSITILSCPGISAGVRN